MIQQDHIITFAAVYCIFYDKSSRYYIFLILYVFNISMLC